MEKLDIPSMALPRLTEWVTGTLGEPKFRAGQIYRWVHEKRVGSFAEMTNLSAALRQKLEQSAFLTVLSTRRRLESRLDETVKLLLELPDQNCVEAVLMRYEHGLSLCISTQVGCRMGCKFCASTLGGLVLTAAVSAGAYFAGTKLCPTRVVRTYVPYATGSEDVDAMLNGIAANLDALHKLNEAIPDPQLSRAMDRMEKAGRSIAAVVEKTPDKARSVDRFARYYLPEVVKLMGTYAALEQNGVRGENAAQIEAELRRNGETRATAFENQLDALYSAEAMDISTDIEVLDSILKSQNLAK